MADWHYIGNYGQLGPLTPDQMKELIEVGVIESSTLVWRDGLSTWREAGSAADLVPFFAGAPSGSVTPPAPPPSRFQPGPSPANPYGSVLAGSNAPMPPAMPPAPFAQPHYMPPSIGPVPFNGAHPHVPYLTDPNGRSISTNRYIPSDKSKIGGGVLNLFLPGVGRMYLGYSAIGALQMILALVGIGFIWSFFDGIAILLGTVHEDGYGRQLIR